MSAQPEDAARFTLLWDTYARRVFAYACRHVDHHSAQEVVSETFLVAWRRLHEVPEQPLPWLLVVARNTMSNGRRAARRRDALTGELSHIERFSELVDGADVAATDRADLLSALASLSDIDREALLMSAWDGLSAAEAAVIAGCSTAAMRVRLFRARRRLQMDAHTQSSPATELRSLQ